MTATATYFVGNAASVAQIVLGTLTGMGTGDVKEFPLKLLGTLK